MVWSQPCALAIFAFSSEPDGADHGDAERLEPLAGDQAHAAGGGMEQNGLAFLHSIDPADQVLHRQTLEHHGSGLTVGNAGQAP